MRPVPSLLLLALCLLFASVPVLAQTPLSAFLTTDAGGPGAGEAWVRVVHLSPDAPEVDVRVNGEAAFTSVGFQEATDYAALPAGTYRVQVEPAGADGAGPFVIDVDLTVEAGTTYTVAAVNELSAIEPLPLIDDNSAPAADQARIRFLHTSPDAPAVDIAVAGGGPVLFSNVAFKEVADYLTVPAGTYDLEVFVAGTMVNVLNLPGIVLEGGAVYTAIAGGLVADGSADRTAYLQDGRFRIEITTTDFDGSTGPALITLPGASDHSALFYFLESGNVEFVVKVLDGQGINDAFWVFFGSITNVGWTATITDTVNDVSKTYENPPGTFASFGDTVAFPTN